MDIRGHLIITPVHRTQLPRFTGEGDWEMQDMTLDSTKVAVSCHNAYSVKSCIDLFALHIPDSSSQFITRFYSKEFKNPSRWHQRYVSFLDDSRVVTVCGDQLDVFNIKTDDVPTHSEQFRNRGISCMSVREGEIFIGLSSNEVIVFDFSLNKIKTITLEGEGRDYPGDITVYGDHLFTFARKRAFRYNMEGVMLHEYNTLGYVANSITVSSEFGLLFVLYLTIPAIVVVYSLSENHTLFSFQVIDELVDKIRINDVNRFMFTTTRGGTLSVYSTMEFRLPGRMSATSSSLKAISDNLPFNPLQMELWINQDGGVLELPGTGVSLKIPPGALEKDQIIQMRIIPYNFQGDSDQSFTSNSSVVVELLPRNLKLLKPAKLTLPHCLVLKKGCEWKAKIYSSHHDEGTQPLWRPQPDTPYLLTERNCKMELTNFSWEKFDIGDEIVEGKRIVLYAAKDLSSSESITHIHVGYYLELPGGEKIVSINKVSVLVKKSAVFFRKGQLPLKCLFEKIEPPAWTYGSEEENPKEISFKMAATSKGLFCTFVLNIKEGTQERHKCTCYFKAGQESELVELLFILKDEEEDSTASSSDKVVDAGLSQSQKRTGVESLTAKQPRENIDLKVRTESLRNPSLPSHQAIRGEAEGNPARAKAMTKDDEVVKDSTLWDLSRKFSKEWRDVGRNLKLDETELENIEADNIRNGQKEMVYKMLLLWKRKHGMEATIKTLRDALKAANRKDLSDYLLNREQGGATSGLVRKLFQRMAGGWKKSEA